MYQSTNINQGHKTKMKDFYLLYFLLDVMKPIHKALE